TPCPRLTGRCAMLSLHTLQSDVLVRRGVCIARDQPEPGLPHPGPHTVDESQLPDRRIDRPLVNKLLNPLQNRHSFLLVGLDRLLLEQLVDVRVAAVRIGASLDDVRLKTGRGVAKGAAAALDDVLELLTSVSLEEGCPLKRP